MSKVLLLDGVKIPDNDYKAKAIRKYITFDNKKAYSEEFVFYGTAFSLIKQKFIDTANGRIASIKVEIRDYCCGTGDLIFQGIIKGDNYSWCDGDCFIKATVIEDNRFLDCIKTQLVSYLLPRTGNPLIATQKGYTTFESVIANTLVILSLVVMPLAGVLELIATIIPGLDKSDIPSITGITRALARFKKVFFHPTPYVRSYLDTICNACSQRDGVVYEWSSDLFGKGQDYNDLVYFSAPSEDAPRQKRALLIEANLPALTKEDWLNKLIAPFNARWYIEGNKLIINQKATKTQVQVLDLTHEKACYTPANDDPASYAALKYQEDGGDLLGNARRADYDHIEDWNLAGNEVMRGRREFNFDFGRANVGKFDDIIKANLYNLPDPNIGGSTATGGLYLKMQNPTCSLPKLLLLKNGQLTNNSLLYGSSLYSKHFTIENPNSTNYRAINFEVTTDLQCGVDYTQGMPIRLLLGEAEADTVTIDYDARTVKFTGTI